MKAFVGRCGCMRVCVCVMKFDLRRINGEKGKVVILNQRIKEGKKRFVAQMRETWGGREGRGKKKQKDGREGEGGYSVE